MIIIQISPPRANTKKCLILRPKKKKIDLIPETVKHTIEGMRIGTDLLKWPNQ